MSRFYGFIGESAAMHSVYASIRQISKSHAPVCIYGATGTGKELAAEAIYKSSSRACRAFIPINCAAVGTQLMESDLFGHVKGAYTGAHADRDGAFILANEGTLFLDEVAELDLQTQAKLLRVLQTGEVRKLGDNTIQKVNVRIICATHKNLFDMVKAGQFREDLFYRLYVIPVVIPKLIDRGEDIFLLADYFLNFYAKNEGKNFEVFSKNSQSLLVQHDWPGNVRELMNIIRALIALCPDDVDQIDDYLNDLIKKNIVGESNFKNSHFHMDLYSTKNKSFMKLIDLENGEIIRALKHFNNNIALAAQALGIHPSTIHRRLKSLDR